MFAGLGSVVDVGGGIGTMAMIISGVLYLGNHGHGSRCDPIETCHGFGDLRVVTRSGFVAWLFFF